MIRELLARRARRAEVRAAELARRGEVLAAALAREAAYRDRAPSITVDELIRLAREMRREVT